MNLKILVVPTETGNGIDQDSTIEQILKCPETVIYEVGELCQALNDEAVTDLNWFFYVDLDKKEILNHR